MAKQIIDGSLATARLAVAERSNFYLHPGQIFVSAESYAVTTILGSCVSACLWDPLTKIGGINHFLLPVEVGAAHASGRFGNLAVRGEGQRYMKVTEGSMTGADSDYVVYTIGLLYKF